MEMQLLHVTGFVNRVVYNACKAYVDQLKVGESYTKLADVVAISICDFVLWPDDAQDRAKLPRVPMLSRWNMTERAAKLAQGRTEGQVRAILALLAARGISLSQKTREHIEACKDAATLDRWIVRAATATSAEEVIVSQQA